MDEVGGSDYPVYGRVQEILIWEDEKLFVVAQLETLEFCSNLMSYKVSQTNKKTVVLHHKLLWLGVLNICTKNGSYFIVEKTLLLLKTQKCKTLMVPACMQRCLY